MISADYPPGTRAPSTASYEELNVLGARTGKVIVAQEGNDLPSAPRGFTWRPQLQRLATELRDLAQQIRRVAATATALDRRDSLLRLSRKIVALAAEDDSRSRY
jgi:hypothetical protein